MKYILLGICLFGGIGIGVYYAIDETLPKIDDKNNDINDDHTDIGVYSYDYGNDLELYDDQPILFDV